MSNVSVGLTDQQNTISVELFTASFACYARDRSRDIGASADQSY